MCAEVTFCGRAIIRIHIYRIVWTGLHAGFAPDATVGVEIDNPVFALIHRGHGTNSDAGRLRAMIATRHLKYAARIWEQSLLDVFDPSPVHADRHLVFGFARHGTSVTSDALAIIDYEAVLHAMGRLSKKTVRFGSPYPQ
jgi:hypothetical protein